MSSFLDSTGLGHLISKIKSTFAYTTHTHGNITSGGTLQATDVTIANGDKIVITDATDSNKVARASISFNGSTITKALSQKGTWENVVNSVNGQSGAVTIDSNTLVVTFSADENENILCDHTIGDIESAITYNKIVIGKIEQFILLLTSCVTDENHLQFTGYYGTSEKDLNLISLVGNVQNNADVWELLLNEESPFLPIGPDVLSVAFDMSGDTITCDTTIDEIVSAIESKKYVCGVFPIYGNWIMTPSLCMEGYIIFSAIANIGGDDVQMLSLQGTTNNNTDTWEFVNENLVISLVNVIESISVNGVSQSITNKNVDITVPVNSVNNKTGDVVLNADDVKAVRDYSKEYLTFEALENATFTFTQKALQYSIDDGQTWSTLSANTASPTVTTGNKILWKQTGLTPNLFNGIGTFSSTGNFNASGNIMSLYYGDEFKGQKDLTGKSYAFYKLFINCSKLVNTENLILPATTLANYCYRDMFRGCTSLTSAPSVLPATTLSNYCYNGMFRGCTSLTTAPELPTITLTDYCYLSMFNGCTSLTTAPELPATTLDIGCYSYMFTDCTSLTSAPELPATTLTNYCYQNMFSGCTSLNYIKCLATDISATDCTNTWVQNVSSGGTFIKADSMTSWTTGNNGIPTGWNAYTESEWKEVRHYELDAAISGITYPVTSVNNKTGDVVLNADDVKAIHDYSKEYLTFEAIEDTTFTFTQNALQYSIDDGQTWSTLSANTASPTITAGNKILWKQTGLTPISTSPYGIGTFSSTGRFNAFGNTMSLFYGDSFEGEVDLTGKNFAFVFLFANCSKIVSVENLILPATTLVDYCYYGMFQGCTALINSPKLPSILLANYCYNKMFLGCTSLVTTPKLPAITLNKNCYYAMFQGCTALTTAPELPATTLADSCYDSMFFGCSSLITAPNKLPATTLTQYCYHGMFYNCTSLVEVPTVLPAKTMALRCYESMFEECHSLVNAPKILATVSETRCFYWMFYNCTSLVKGPDILLASLSDLSCRYMFYGCTSLNYIKCLATDISASTCTYNWVNGVAETGTFIKDDNMNDWTTGNDGIPSGWSVYTESEWKEVKHYELSDVSFTGDYDDLENTPDILYKKIAEKEYSPYTCSANTLSGASIFFMNVVPTSDNWFVPWSIKYRLYITTTEQYTQSMHDCQFGSMGTSYCYAYYNNVYSTSYLPTYNHKILWYNTQAKYNNRETNPIKIGERIYSSRGVTTLARTIKVEVYEAINCTFELLDNFELYQDIYTADKYGYETEITAYSNGLQETGDTNYPNYYNYDYYNGYNIHSTETPLYRYKLCGFDIYGRLVPITSTNQTSETIVTKTPNTVPMDLSRGIVYYGSTTTVSDPNTLLATGVIYRNRTDTSTTLWKYNFNTAPIAKDNVYLVGDYQNGLFTLDSTSGNSYYVYTKNVGTDQELLSGFTEGKYYVYIGNVNSSIYMNLLLDNPLYYFDGTSLRPVNGMVVNSVNNKEGSVVLNADDVKAVHDYSKEYLTTVALEDGTISFIISQYTNTDLFTSISYSTDNGVTWNTTNNSDNKNNNIQIDVNVSEGDKVLWKGVALSLSNMGSDGVCGFISDIEIDVEGNIMSLLYGDGFVGKTSLSGISGIFYELFATGINSGVNVVNAKNLMLPATTLANYCYVAMFQGCISLTTAPELPATTLANSCYNSMFYGCTSLTKAPELPATTLIEGCYENMFFGCTSLTSAPELPTTTLANSCYSQMFSGCIFLTSAPELPATTLVEYCYSNMFYNCTSLNYIKCLATDISATHCTTNWVQNVSSTGVFIKSDNTIWGTGPDAIPDGWDVHKDTEWEVVRHYELNNIPIIEYNNELYYKKSNDKYYPVSDPDLSTQQSLLPSRFGLYNMYEVLIPVYGEQNAASGDMVSNEYIVSYMDENNKFLVFTSGGVVYDGSTIMEAHLISNDVYSSVSILKDGYNYKIYPIIPIDSYKSSLDFLYVKYFSEYDSYYSKDNRDYSKDYLTFTALEDTTFSFTKSNLEYSLNNGFYWSTLSAGQTTPTVSAGNKILWKQTGLTPDAYDGIGTFSSTGNFNVSGNIMSLYYGDEFIGKTDLTGKDYAFFKMFRNCDKLVNTKNLILPATTLAEYCYREMFRGCTSLTTAPELPATTLVNNCYQSMFNGCTSLTKAPELPATTLVRRCYGAMFQGCTSLVTAPELPATTLAETCYHSMFSGCTSLNYIKCLATDISANYCTTNWVQNVSSTGTFVKNPTMNNWATGSRGVPTDWTVENA